MFQARDPLKCDKCEFTTYGRPQLLDRHKERAHSNSQRKKLCTVCGVLIDYQSFTDHMKKHVVGKNYKCDICFKSFTTSSNMRTHKLIHGDPLFICQHCGKQCQTPFRLARHVKTHTGEKPHQCPQCDKSYTRADNLKTHMRTHTGEKPYECMMCGERFTYTVSLQGHMKTVHGVGKT